MKKLNVLTMVLAAGLVMSVAARDREEPKWNVRATVELKDGSRLVGTPVDKSLPLKLDFMKADIPLAQIRSAEVRHKDGQVALSLQNGDRLTGVVLADRFALETALGRLKPDFAQINRLTFTNWREGNMPAGEGSLLFGGVNWLPWRTQFEVQGDKLVSLPKARAGFNYGHSGNGRGATLMSNIGHSDWKDYCIEVEFCVTGTDPAFNPYGLGADYHDGGIFFHVADAKESWNERGSSCYSFGLSGNGTWSLACVYNEFFATPVGYGNGRRDAERKLASGGGLKLDRVNGNKFRLEVRGQRIQIWVDGEPVADVTDEKMGETIGGQTLDHGGVGFGWGWEAMGWIRNFSARGL
jgi:hypothetical protein